MLEINFGSMSKLFLAWMKLIELKLQIQQLLAKFRKCEQSLIGMDKINKVKAIDTTVAGDAFADGLVY